MKENNNLKKGKKYLVIGIVVLFLSILGASVSYYLARVQGTLTGRAAGTELEISVTKLSTNATGDLIPLDNDLETLGQAALGYGNSSEEFDSTKACIDINGYSVCQIYKVRVTNNGTVPLTMNGTVTLSGQNVPNIDCAKMDDEVTVTNNNSCKSGMFVEGATLPANNHLDYYIMVYINNLDEPQYDSGTFNGTVTFTTEDGRKVKGRFNPTYNAVQYIKDKFDNATTKTIVSAADGVDYKYATSENLMYDRLGGTTANLEEGNLRYYGADPDNYVAFGNRNPMPWKKIPMFANVDATSEECYQAASCTLNYSGIGAMFDMEFANAAECEEALPSILTYFGVSSIDEICSEYTLYRIIGVFDGNLKIIKNDSIGDYSWDTSSSDINEGDGINEWSQADLMKLLNPGYEGNQDLDNNEDTITVNNSLWWNSESGTCYVEYGNTTAECDFSETGLSNEIKDLIVEKTWYLGGISNVSGVNVNEYEYKSYAKGYYELERGSSVFPYYDDGVIRTTSWNGKVGLMYPSDYGYAADLNVCRQKLNNYNNSGCTSTDWLRTDYNQWTITSLSTFGYLVIGINSNGKIKMPNTKDGDKPRPVFYLNAAAIIESGTGTKTDPYIIG